ncbi:toll/interleukin-1 receptor domain-containing protein [Paenibacillus sp. FSL H7-0940]|uniref:toll/interleukin-1 receptor domain-containing protein n=1 Tax=Paenibacillus sp. FSL H7-0940 TaxID=2921443 RepID=UPI0030EEC2BA
MADYDTIFISHAHHDRAYVKELVDLIKVVGFNEIVCSSYPGYGIPQDNNIYEFLKEKLMKRVWVIFVLSKEYYQSAACLNEMGATWVLGQYYTTILLPNYNFNLVKGAIDPSRVAFKINDKSGLSEFKENLVKHLQLVRPSDSIWESARDEVIQKVNNYAAEERKKNITERVEVDDVLPKSDGSSFIVMLRLINDNDYSIDFHQVTLILTDENQNEIKLEYIHKEKLFHKENKLLQIEFSLDSTNKYDPFSHGSFIANWVARRNYS